MAAAASLPRWVWLTDHGSWSPFSPDISAQLELAFADATCRGLGLTLIPNSNTPTHHVDLERMVQINARTGFPRPVRREDGITALRGQWSFEDQGMWVPYDAAASGQLSAARAANRPGTLVHGGSGRWSYWVDLQRMVQENQITGKQRRLVFTAAGAANNGDLASLTKWTVLQPGEWEAGSADPVMLNELGEDGESVVRLPCHTAACSCTFNVSTVEAAFQSSNACPACGTKFNLPGPQPSGSMSCRVDPFTDCDGHEGVGTLVLIYAFPSGMQQPQHPTPGAPYRGTTRECYLPNDAIGNKALVLLRAAFVQGALFRVGSSATTGRENVVVWAIHQKTALSGGATRHGWPDESYLERLQSECAAANVVGALS